MNKRRANIDSKFDKCVEFGAVVFSGGMSWFLGALGVETVACWLQSKMDSSRVSLIRCRLNQQSHEAMLPISNI